MLPGLVLEHHSWMTLQKKDTRESQALEIHAPGKIKAKAKTKTQKPNLHAQVKDIVLTNS